MKWVSRVFIWTFIISLSLMYFRDHHLKTRHLQVEILNNTFKPIDISNQYFWVTDNSQVLLTKDNSAIQITGPIDDKTYKKFKTLLTDKITTVIISSPGGDVTASVEISKLIYNNKLDTEIPNKGECFSGCTMIFQAGQRRVAYSNTLFGYHYATATLKDGSEKTSAYGTGVYWSYLAYFGVNPVLIEQFTDKEVDYFIKPKESMKYNIVTMIIPVDNGG